MSETDAFYHEPKKVNFFKGKIVTWISCGQSHSVGVTVEGYTYSWGRNNRGQLGHGSEL